MNANSVLTSRYLKLADIQNLPRVLTVADVEMEVVREGKEPEPVVYFREVKQGLVCSKGRWDSLKAFFGIETDAWVGQSVSLTIGESKFGPTTKVEMPHQGVTAIRPLPMFDKPVEDEIPF